MTLPLRVYGRLCPGLKIIQIQTLLLLRSKITSMNIIMKNLIWQISPRNSGLIIIIFLRILISIFQKGSADIWIRCGLKNPEKVKEVISEDCLKSLLSAPEHSKIGIRDTTIMVILYDSAIRLSELLNLKISDVNLQKSTPYLRIHGKGDKERIVSISDNTVAHIKRYMRYYHEESILTMDTSWVLRRL